MKKLVFVMLLVAGGFAALAQDPVYNNTSTGTYNAYATPDYVKMDFQKNYPEINDVIWADPTTDWYHSYYVRNGHYSNIYYSTDPYYNISYYPERVTGYMVALPVLQTYVPDAVISKASDLYKNNLYDITALKNANKEDVYQVRVLGNGQLQTLWMTAEGAEVTNVYRTDADINLPQTSNVTTITTSDSNAAMDNTKTKIKTKTADGKKTVTKTKNGKTKTKSSDNNDQ
jgi:hypothetical protein